MSSHVIKSLDQLQEEFDKVVVSAKKGEEWFFLVRSLKEEMTNHDLFDAIASSIRYAIVLIEEAGGNPAGMLNALTSFLEDTKEKASNPN